MMFWVYLFGALLMAIAGFGVLVISNAPGVPPQSEWPVQKSSEDEVPS